ncbi:acyltransferase family protein [Neptunomonas japonica]|uniref:acyltransferase family protein n=1 Tax=Neptunomonas japonica TaxID=417574 RepID=UPI0003F93F8C|nr:acyltransferase [Neptunomonas japonica]
MNRLIEFDSLRGIAALLVVLFHYTYQYFNIIDGGEPITTLFTYGGLGVQLFFIISGFVILVSLHHSKDIFYFYISRFSRLYPPYWFAVCFSSLVVILSGKYLELTDFLMNLTMFQYFFSIDDIDGVYWTLRVELTFYFWVSIFYFFLTKNNFKFILIVWLLASLVIPFINNTYEIYNSFPLFKVFDRLFMLQFTPFFLSGIAFYYYKNEVGFRYSLFVILLCLLVVYVNDSIKYTIVLLLIDIIVFLVLNERMKFLNNKFFLFMGSISYSLYLIHQLFGYYLIGFLSEYIMIELSILITIFVVVFIAYVVKESVEIKGRVFFRNILFSLKNTIEFRKVS